jgi:futalosine hydrolase
MRLLVCAATAWELSAWGTPDEKTTLQVTGVGAPATFAALGERPPADILLNIGIAGAYQGSGLALGDIVVGESEVWGDLGFALPESPYFRPLQQSEFGAFYTKPLPLWIPPGLEALGARRGQGCTVHTCTGTDAQGQQRHSLFSADFETMEGAALAQLGKGWKIPVCQLRAISNYAAHRDMRPENLRQAHLSLTSFLSALKAHPELLTSRQDC